MDPFRTGNKTEMFVDLTEFPVIQKRKEEIHSVLSDIMEHRREVRLVLKNPSLDYTTVSGQQVIASSILLTPVFLNEFQELSTKAILKPNYASNKFSTLYFALAFYKCVMHNPVSEVIFFFGTI